MDNLTHTLFALTLARTPLGRLGRGTTAALVLASNAPDIDIVAAARGAVSYLAWHRGPTHGPLAVVGLGMAVTGLVAVATRLSGTRGRPASLSALAALSAIGIGAHILMDLATVYGTRLLSPFDWRWFAVDWMPIIDVYLLATLAAGLWIGRRSDRAGAWSAIVVLFLLGGNYGLRAAAHARALATAQRWLPPPCVAVADPPAIDRWPTVLAARAAGRPSAERRRGGVFEEETACLTSLAALPSFTSPFRWQIVAQSAEQYDVADLDLWQPDDDLTRRPRFRMLPPAPRAERFRTEAASPIGRVFLDFARFPTETSTVDGDATTIRWRDVRFMAPPARAGRTLPDMFAIWVRVGADGRIIAEGMGR